MTDAARIVPMPQLGQAMEFGIVVQWLAGDGASVREGEPIATIESDKAAYEITAPTAGQLRHEAEIGAQIDVGIAIATILPAPAPGGIDPAPPVAPLDTGSIVVMPQLGQAMEFGILVGWLAEEGEVVAEGATIATIESDKAAYEIPAPASGPLHRRAETGVEIPVGTTIATIGHQTAPQTIAAAAPAVPASEAAHRPPAPTPAGGRAMASPKAKATAQRLGISLASLRGSAADGMILARDVEAAAARPPAGAPAVLPPIEPAPPPAGFSPARRAAADRLARSWQQAPHFVQMVETDATRLMQARAAITAGTLRCGLNDILIAAAARVMARFPDLNMHYGAGGPVALAGVAVGLAVASDSGLRVPVVRDADRLDIAQIAQESRRLIEAARAGALRSADQGGASLSISNLGRYGVRFGTPVLNLGEPLLVFVGTIEERAVGENGRVVLRPSTTLSLCYDHRIADGLRAAEFSQAFRAELESLDWLGLPAPTPDTGEDAGTVALLALVEATLVASLQTAAARYGVTIERIEARRDGRGLVIGLHTDASDGTVASLAGRAKRRTPLLDLLAGEVRAGIDIVKLG